MPTFEDILYSVIGQKSPRVLGEEKQKEASSELKTFEEKEKIKQKYSETVAALEKTNQLLENYNKRSVARQQISKAGIPVPTEEDDYDSLLQEANMNAAQRGILKKTTGADLPMSESEFLLETKRKATQEAFVLREKKEEEGRVKIEDFRREYDSFRAINSLVQPFRSTGGIVNRTITGGKLFIEELEANTPLGNALAAYNAASKKLRVSIARLKDVGNLSAVEQLASQALIAGKYDTQETAALKDSFLQDIADGIDKKDFGRVKQTIQKWMQTDAWKNQVAEHFKDMPEKEKAKRTFKSEEEAEAADLPVGSIVMINGQIYIKE